MPNIPIIPMLCSASLLQLASLPTKMCDQFQLVMIRKYSVIYITAGLLFVMSEVYSWFSSFKLPMTFFFYIIFSMTHRNSGI